MKNYQSTVLRVCHLEKLKVLLRRTLTVLSHDPAIKGKNNNQIIIRKKCCKKVSPCRSNYFLFLYRGSNSTFILFRQFESRVNMAWTVIYNNNFNKYILQLKCEFQNE